MQSSRLLKKKHMNEETEISYNNIRHMETYIVANSIAEQLKYQLHITYSNNDMEYLCRQLYAHRVTHHVKHMRTDYEETVRDVIKRMSEIQKLDLTRDKKLYESLLYHLPPMILRLQNNIQIVNPMLDNIKQEYPELFTTMWYALTQIELRYQVTLTEDEVSLILLHFQVALDQFEQVGNIVVVCTYGVSSSQLILSRVKQILPAKDNITVTTTKKLKEIDLSKVDLIISSVDIEDPEISYVKVNPLLTKDDYANILDAYTKQVLLIKNNVCDNQKNGIKAPTLKKYLEGKFIFLKQDLDSKEKCLDFIIDVLEKDNAVYDEFREAIYKREKLGVTCLDTGVALPHADPQTIKKSRIILLTLKHPVDWGGTLVSLIVVTAFPENYYEGISNREKEYPTGLLVNQTGFAIPHTDSERVNKSQICFLSLDEPIEFEDMVDKSHKISVELVFMLAMAQPHEQVNTLQNLIALFQDDEKVAKLKECNTEKELMQILNASGIE